MNQFIIPSLIPCVMVYIFLQLINLKMNNIIDKIDKIYQLHNSYEEIIDNRNFARDLKIENLSLELIRKEEIIKTKKNCNNFNEDALHRDVTKSYTHS